MRKYEFVLCASSQKHRHYCYVPVKLTKLGPDNREIRLLKSLIIGMLLGITAGAAAVYFVPPVDLVRERSIIEVTPNGGNSEVFHTNIPDDRILIGVPDQAEPVPRGLDWPREPLFANARTELFKVRNANDTVVGVASRIAASGPEGAIVEWVFHMPARGSGYILMRPKVEGQPFRTGDLRSGTHEFEKLVGVVTERWIGNSDSGENAPAGRIELSTRLVARLEEET